MVSPSPYRLLFLGGLEVFTFIAGGANVVVSATLCQLAADVRHSYLGRLPINTGPYSVVLLMSIIILILAILRVTVWMTKALLHTVGRIRAAAVLTFFFEGITSLVGTLMTLVRLRHGDQVWRIAGCETREGIPRKSVGICGLNTASGVLFIALFTCGFARLAQLWKWSGYILAQFGLAERRQQASRRQHRAPTEDDMVPAEVWWD